MVMDGTNNSVEALTFMYTKNHTIKSEIFRLAKQLHFKAEETSKDFFRIYRVDESFDMGFHDIDETTIHTGTGKTILRVLRVAAGECASAPMPGDVKNKNEHCTLAEATWITDLLRLPSERVEDVRAAVTRVMDARQR